MNVLRDEGLREALVRAHEDIVTMYARHEPGWDVVHDWHADPGDLFKARAAFAAIFARAAEYADAEYADFVNAEASE